MHIFLYLLPLLKPAVASPVNFAATSSGSACLAVLVTLFMLLLLLVIAKRLFIKQRRLQRYRSSGSENSFIVDSFVHSSTSILPSSVKIESTNHKTGILVGFLGSPAWETSVRTLTDPSIREPHKRCYAIYHLQTQRRLVKHPRSQVSDTRENLTLDAEKTRSISVSVSDEISTSRDIQSLQRTTRPSRSSSGTFRTAVPRRRSLPSLYRKEIHDSLRLKRSRSLKCPRLRSSDVPTSSSSGDRSLRLVENAPRQEYTLPLSPKYPNAPFPLPVNSLAHSPDSASDSYVLPVTVSSGELSSSSTPGSDCSQRRSSTVLISSPYALISKTERVPPNVSPLVRKVPRSRLKGVNESAPPAASPSDSKATCQTPIFRKPLSQITPAMDLDLSVPLPLVPVNPVRPTKIESLSVRVRRSPPIGPSPLRTMILADDSDAASVFQNNDISPGSRDSSVSGQTYYGHLGFGLPTPSIDHELPHDPSEASQDRSPRQHVKTSASRTSDEDPNILLGIIRELVQETSEWDASLFMDDNFKLMIQNSELMFPQRTEDKSDTETGPAKRKTIELPDGSEELDLGLTGVNVLGSHGPTFRLDSNSASQETSRTDVENLISFWDEGGWSNERRNDM